ncbi:hypothetical protein D7X33_19410 [Butyricicoccus sp. 1XD8-22]|nr:hypothetical protein D7X33_19410 [Butyricicoccus sp. 1XD8-22]
MKFPKTICLTAACFCCGILAYQLLPRQTVIEVNDSTPYISLEEMVVKADVIVTGNISESGVSQWDRAQDGSQLDRIHTDVQVEPEAILSDSPEHVDSALEVRTYVGEIGNVSQISSSRPALETGEDVLLFLQKIDDEQTERYDIMGYMQGKFTLEDENGELVYTNGRDRIPAGELTDTIETILDKHSATEWPSDYYSPEEIESMNNALFHIDE